MPIKTKENKVRIIKQTDSDTCLVFFPYVGAGWTAFLHIANHLKGDFSILSVNPSGHSGDVDPLLDNINDMANLYYSELKPYLRPNMILCGYSLGCLVIHNLLKKIEKDLFHSISVIIAASIPPHFIESSKKISSLNNVDIINFFHSIGGIPEVLLQEKELLELYLPALKADYHAFETYKTEITKFDYPCFLIYGKSDNFVKKEYFLEWDKYFNNPPVTYYLNGNHLLIRDNPFEFAETLQQIMNIIKRNNLELEKNQYKLINQ